MAQRVRKSASYEPEHKTFLELNGGVNYEKPASKLKESEFSDSLNLQFYKGLLRVDSGYSVFRTPVKGTPLGQFEFVTTAGQVQELLLTTKYLYLDNGTQWSYTGDNIVNTTVNAINSNTSFKLGSVAGINVGDDIALIQNDGTQLQATIASIDTVNNIIVLNGPGSAIISVGAAVVHPRSLNGNTAFQPSTVTWPPLNVFIFTNGVDPVMQFNGSTLAPLPGWTIVQSCRILLAFHGFLIAFDTTENGVRNPQRTRWTDQGNAQALTGGLSGFVDLQDTEDFIETAETLGPWVIIYREASIMRRSYIGDPFQLFFDEYMVQGVGVFGPGCVANTGASHVITGPEGIFRYDGGYSVESVGDSLFDNLMGAQGILNTAAVSTIFTFYVAELDEVWLFVPTGANLFPDTVYRLDQGNDAWWPRKFANLMIGFGFIEAKSGRTWQQALQAWNTDTTPWLSRAKQVQAPLTVLCDAVNNATYLYDFVSPTDNTAPISWFFVTKDFESPERKVIFDGLWAKGTGNNVLVEISYDRGQNFHTVGTLSFGLTFSTQQVNMQLEVDVFRLRVSGTDPASSIDWYRVDYYLGHPW